MNGPFTPDLATPVSEMKAAAQENGWPTAIEYGLIGSCTNSSYEDISRSASIAKQAVELGIESKGTLNITPGSEQVRFTIERDGRNQYIPTIRCKCFCKRIVDLVLVNGQERELKRRRRTRLFTHLIEISLSVLMATPITHAFVASPELVTAIAIAGDLTFNPITDPLYTKEGKQVMLAEPVGEELPSNGFDVEDAGYLAPAEDGSGVEVVVDACSDQTSVAFSFPSLGWRKY